VPNLPFGSVGCCVSLHRLTWPRQHPCGPGHQGRYPAGYPRPRPGGRRHAAVVSRCLSAAGLRFSAIPARQGLPPLLRSAYRPPKAPDPDGVSVFRTCEIRPEWAPSLPRDRRCSREPPEVLARRPPPSCGTGPALRHCRHLSGAAVHEASPRVHAIRPPGLPLARGPRMTREPLRRLPWAPHPRGQDPRTHARAGTGLSTSPELRRRPAQHRPSNLQVHSQHVRPHVAPSATATPSPPPSGTPSPCATSTAGGPAAAPSPPAPARSTTSATRPTAAPPASRTAFSSVFSITRWSSTAGAGSWS
jgi:hypothetical protein